LVDQSAVPDCTVEDLYLRTKHFVIPPNKLFPARVA
jgi:hypothetical protein